MPPTLTPNKAEISTSPSPSPGSTPILTIEDLRTHFLLDQSTVRAVDGVSLTVPRGRTLGVVGESGSGKSQTASSILQLIRKPGRIVGGKIIYHGDGDDKAITTLEPEGSEMRRIRGGAISMIFQEPMTSLSPVHRVGPQISETVRLHTDLSSKEVRRRAIETMGLVEIPDPEMRYRQYPHELSGGLRQRAMIAMALACRPPLLIADEPTTALDVTTQSQILSLMQDLQQQMGMAIMLITHDLGVIAEMAHEVAVMYLGRVVERGSVYDLFDKPQHPYTRALLQSMPDPDQSRRTRLKTIRGSVPSSGNQPAGCPFHPRCDEAVAGKCNVGQAPPLIDDGTGHANACLIRHEEAGYA